MKKENGIKEEAKTVKPTQVILSVKQRKSIVAVLAEKAIAEKTYNEAVSKEAAITELILDAHGIDSENVASVALDEQQVMFSVILKEEKELEKKDG